MRSGSLQDTLARDRKASEPLNIPPLLPVPYPTSGEDFGEVIFQAHDTAVEAEQPSEQAQCSSPDAHSQAPSINANNLFEQG